MMNNDGAINEIAGLATIAICVMTFISFGITTGLWEEPFWCSGMEIIDYEGYWGEDLVVTYLDGTTESVKGISNSYWSTMSIRDDNSDPISVIQYCLNAKIPTSDTFDITGYECVVTVSQDDVVFYCTTCTYVDFVVIEANEWVRVVTVPLDVQDVAERLNNGRYTVSFDNVGTIKGIGVPDDGRSIDIVVDDGIVTFLV